MQTAMSVNPGASGRAGEIQKSKFRVCLRPNGANKMSCRRPLEIENRYIDR